VARNVKGISRRFPDRKIGCIEQKNRGKSPLIRLDSGCQRSIALVLIQGLHSVHDPRGICEERGQDAARLDLTPFSLQGHLSPISRPKNRLHRAEKPRQITVDST